MTSIEARFELARRIAREAGDLAATFFENRSELLVESKGLQDVVSRADREVEDLVRARILQAFPDDPILGEEGGGAVDPASSRPIWVIDPIDGTQCFLSGLLTWCIAIALVHGGDTVYGVIYDPNAGELFAGGPGSGAECNGQPIGVHEAADLTEGMMEVGFSHRCSPEITLGVLTKLLNAGGIYHRCGSGALALAHVAAGRYIAYFEEHMNAWDSLAAAALVRGAGGWTNDLLANNGLLDGAMVVAGGYPLAPVLRALVGEDFGCLMGGVHDG